MQNYLLENLFTYKKTTALLAAFQLGLFERIKEHGCINKEMFSQIGWNIRNVELLCVYLRNEGYLSYIDGCYQLSKEFESQLDAFKKICEHESSLYYKWLSPEQIVSSVKLAEGRLFDKEGFTPEEQASYDNVMYGSNSNLIAFHLIRKIKRDKTSLMRCLEFGRSGGHIGQALKKLIPKISLDIVSLDQKIENQFLYDVIVIYNTIHYKTSEDWESTFCQMKNVLNENGIVCVADVFYKGDNVFSSTVVLDWITHGGVYNIYCHEVAEQLRDSGFTKVEQQFIDSISTNIMFAYK